MRIRSLLAFIFVTTVSAAAGQKLQQDPNLVTGRLDNGLTYYIYPGTKPEGQAMYRLFIKSGSLYETEEQLGLAHFLEHMAFNGSDDFPDGSLVPELQAKGAGFGSDINAHTGMNETVYKLRLPSLSEAAVDSAIMVLANWAGKLTLDSAAVEKERGIIMAEWLTRTGPATEVNTAFLNELLNGSHYTDRRPIGDTAVIRNFKLDQLQDYYYNWYNPRLMAVAVTGDVDPDYVEQVIRERFSDIPAPKIKVPVCKIHNYKQPAFSYKQHETVKTNEFYVIQLTDLSPAIKDEKSYFQYLQRVILDRLYRERFNSIALTNPAYKEAGSSISSLLNVKGYIMGRVMLKDGQTMEGIREFAGHYEQIYRYGFLQSEVDKVTKSYINSLKRKSKADDRRESNAMTDELYSKFYRGHEILTLQEECRLAEKYIDRIDSLSMVKMLHKMRKPKQTHYFMVCDESPENQIPDERTILALFDSLSKAGLEPYRKDVRVFDTLLDEEPQGGKVVKKESIEELGAHKYHLSNGALVLFKYSDTSKGRISMSAFRQGGIAALDSLDYVNAQFAGSVVALSGAGKFSTDELGLFLAGSSATSRFLIDRNRAGIAGGASTDDLEQMFQLTYLKWCYPNMDPSALELYKSMQSEKNKERFKRESDLFSMDLNLLLNGNSYMNRPLTDILISKELDPGRLLPVFDQCFGSAEGFNFIIVGDVAAEDIEPLIEKYIGGLPSGKEVAIEYKYKGPQIIHQDTVLVRSVGDNPKASVIIYYQNDGSLTDMRQTKMTGEIAAGIIRTKLLASLREELNMVYSVGVSASLTTKPSDLNRVAISFSCKPEDVDTLTNRILSDLKDMVSDPSRFEAELADVRLNMIKKYRADIQTNTFWTSGIREVLYYGFPDWEYMTGYDNSIESVTAQDVADYVDKYIFNSHQLKAVLLPKVTTPDNSDPD